jgi:small subunit ribosomal protein S17
MARSIIGTVVSNKADKTIVLVITERKTHPIYKKQYSRTVKYISHDEKNEANVGDKVEVKEVRPISARKRLNLVRIIERAAIAATDTVDAITAEPEEKEPVKEETK